VLAVSGRAISDVIIDGKTGFIWRVIPGVHHKERKVVCDREFYV